MAQISSDNERVNILLVDDRPENLLVLKAILSDPAYNLVTATSGPEALKHVLAKDFAVILLDVLMPGMDGFEVASLIKKRRRSHETPLIFLTAAGSDVGLIYRGYSVGAVDYLLKPVNPDVVRAKVAVFVDLFRKARQIQRQSEQLRAAEQREREIQLAELRLASERHYRNLAEAIPQIVWTARPDGAVDYWNRQWSGYTGLDFDQARGWGWVAALHPDDQEPFVAGWRSALERGSLYEAECRLRRGGDGLYRWQLCHAVPERNNEGQIVAWLGTFTDFDDQRRARAEAQEALRLREEFIAIASHELRAPLTTLRLQLGAMERIVCKQEAEGISERLPKRIEAAIRQIDRMSRLIGNLLDLTRITAGKLSLEPESFDLSALMGDLVETFGQSAARAGCKLALHAEGPVTGTWDRLRIEQVATNLLSNALKYGTGHPIEVFVSQEGDKARLEVRDHGRGIPQEDLERIFERYERAMARDKAGLGLGLFISRQIVEAHGGTIGVTSEIGSGSTFTVQLPLHASCRSTATCNPPEEERR
ncbi:MAG: ATP-binding protein [Myxococcaceae bacterium]